MEKLLNIQAGTMLIGMTSLPFYSYVRGSLDVRAGATGINDVSGGRYRGLSWYYMQGKQRLKQNGKRNGYEYDLIKSTKMIKIGEKSACVRNGYDLWWNRLVLDKVAMVIELIKARSCVTESINDMHNGIN